MLWPLLALALAKDPPEPDLSAAVHGDVKSFFLATFPYDAPGLMPPGPTGQGVGSARIILEAGWRDAVDFEVHHALSVQSASGATLAGFGTGVTLGAPEAIDLSWSEPDGPDLIVQGRADRLLATVHGPGLDVALGRQPITFGSGLIFTPLDLVNPFSFATIDQEYKPGVDALRIDAYAGMASRLTVVAAYGGGWDLDGLVLAAVGQATVGVTDLSVLVGEIHADEVVGASVVSALGPVGVHGDLSVTLPDGGGTPFVRAVLGADHRPTPTTTVSGELYVQTFGATDPSDYLSVYTSERFARGEVWTAGRTYAALMVAQELTPLLSVNLAAIANLEDPSAVLAPTLSWSVGENATLGAGVYAGLGERPTTQTITVPDGAGGFAEVDVPRLRSELGATPVVAFTQLSAYF